MKKIISILLTALLVFALAVPAFAVETDVITKPLPGGAEGDVNVKVDMNGNGTPDEDETITDTNGAVVTDESGQPVVPPVDPETVYSIRISWESLDFMYSGGVWSPDDLAYVDGEWRTKGETGWVADSVQNINVENRSNAAVTYDAYFGTADTVEKTTNNVKAELGFTGTKTLGSAVGATGDKGPNEDITVTVSGTPNSNNGFTVGTITVSLSEV